MKILDEIVPILTKYIIEEINKMKDIKDVEMVTFKLAFHRINENEMQVGWPVFDFSYTLYKGDK